MGRAGLLLGLMLLVGCGGDGTSGNPGGGSNPPPHVPSLHVLYPDTSASPLGAGNGGSVGPFTLPSAQISYAITERTTTITQDTWTVGVASSTELARANAGQDYRAYALKSHITGGVSSSDTVPADTYYLIVLCENVIDDCIFSYQVSATY